MIEIEAWTCPAPLRDFRRVVLGHGGGGRLSADLVTHLFSPCFSTGEVSSDASEVHCEAPADSAVLDVGGARIAFSTDSYVVRPLFFPGGCVGDLAVNGTVNDLAMSGAVPIALSCGFILEEGLELEVLGRVATAMGLAARTAGVRLVTGDTKVVERGHGDGIYVNTSGVGLVPAGVDLRPDRARPGDRVIVSGPIGEHGIAIMSVREGLAFGTEIRSDTAPLAGLVAAMLTTGTAADTSTGTGTATRTRTATGTATAGGIRVLRDPTRGGLAATLCEISAASQAGVEIIESAVPVSGPVQAACALLGLDPMQVANEGRLVAFVADAHAEAVLDVMRGHPLGAGATIIGTVTAEHPGVVVGRSAFGGTRIIDLPFGEQLPRIC